MIRVVSASLAPGVPGVIGMHDGVIILMLDTDQMEAMPWDERIRVCNELLNGQGSPTYRIGPTIEREARLCERSRVVRLETPALVDLHKRLSA